MQMKNFFLLFAATMTIGTAFTQVPQKLSYEAIIRDNAFVVLESVQVGIELSVVSDTYSMSSAVYTETHIPTTSANGLVQLLIGSGTTADTFSNIDWADGPYYLMTKIDPAGGTDYTISGVTEMLAVPYAQLSVSATKADTAGRASGLNFRVSGRGDSLILENGDFLILPGVSPPSYPEEYVLCDTANPAIVQTVTSTTDRVWMDRNLGASRVAQSSDDNLAHGDLFQWGRFADGHQCRNSETTSTEASTSASPGGAWDGKFILPPILFDWLSTPDNMLWQGVNGVNNPCPTGFRLPSESEWQAEKDLWSENNSTGAFASPLKLPASGYRAYNGSGDTFNVGSWGYYWSSSVFQSYGKMMRFSNSTGAFWNYYRAYGLTVRCIKEQEP